MRLFITSDTHDCHERELALISKEAWRRHCECIIHCGDLSNAHFGHPALGYLPIYVIRTRINEDLSEDVIKNLPANWHVLEDNDHQILALGGFRVYINHYLGIDVLKSNLGTQTTEAEILDIIERYRLRHGDAAATTLKNELFGDFSATGARRKVMPFELVERIREKFGAVRYVLFGHSHHQFYHVNYKMALINPGAFDVDMNGIPKRSFATIDTKTWDIVFSKVLMV